MLEQNYFKEIDFDNERNFAMDITKDSAIDRNTISVGEEYLASGPSMKPVRNNDVTRCGNYPKFENLSKKHNSDKRTKEDLLA